VKPKTRISSGTSAIMGVVTRSRMYGVMIFSISGTWVITAARMSPMLAPMANPLNSSIKVICMCGQKRSPKRVTSVLPMALGGGKM
jgi:hypothetical protein